MVGKHVQQHVIIFYPNISVCGEAFGVRKEEQRFGGGPQHRRDVAASEKRIAISRTHLKSHRQDFEFSRSVAAQVLPT